MTRFVILDEMRVPFQVRYHGEKHTIYGEYESTAVLDVLNKHRKRFEKMEYKNEKHTIKPE